MQSTDRGLKSHGIARRHGQETELSFGKPGASRALYVRFGFRVFARYYLAKIYDRVKCKCFDFGGLC